MFSLLYPKLSHCRRLFLRNYEILTSIGIFDFEKKNEQRILINVDLFIPLAVSTPKQDLLEEVVDYDFIRSTISMCISKGHIHLQETLCDSVVQAILKHPKIYGVRVSTEKPDVYLDCNSVGIEVFRIKDNMF